MSKIVIYILLAVSLGLNVGVIATTLVHRTTSPAQAPPPGPGGGEGPGPGQRPDPGQIVEDHVRGMTRHLDLDLEQQEAIRVVLVQHTSQLVMFRVNADEANRRLVEAFAAPALDPVSFQQLTAEASAARSKVDSLSAVMLVAEAAVLTPEQRRKFAEVAPSIHSTPQRPPRRDGPPPR